MTRQGWWGLIEGFWSRPERVLERRCRQLNRRIQAVRGRIRARIVEIEQVRAKTTEAFREFDRALFRLEMANGHDPTRMSFRRRNGQRAHEEGDHGAKRGGSGGIRRNRWG